MDAYRGADRGANGERLNAHLAGGLVGEQRHQFVGEAPKSGGVGPFIAESGQFVGNQWVVCNMYTHAVSLVGDMVTYQEVATQVPLRVPPLSGKESS